MTASDARVVTRLVGAGRPAVIALREAIASAKASDPLAAVTVAPPSAYAGLSLRRELARGGGLANVRVTVLARVAELLGAPLLAGEGRVPLTAAVQAHAVSRAIAARASPFASASGQPAALRALIGRLSELAEASPETLERLLGLGGRAAALVTLGRQVRAATSGFYDTQDLAAAAARAVRESRGPVDDVGHVIVHLPSRISPAYRDLLSALRETDRVSVLVALTGDAAADRPTHELLASLEPILGAPAGPVPVESAWPVARLIVAPDPDVEVRRVTQDLVAHLERGVGLFQMAVLYRAPDPYARLVAEHLRSCDLPVAGPGTATLGQGVVGRTLRSLVSLHDDGMSRQAVLALLNGGPIRAGEARAPVVTWERLSREANIVQGPQRWQQRLSNLAARLEATGHEGDRHDAVRAVELRDWVTALVDRSAPPDPTTWPGWADWATGLLDHYLAVGRLDAADRDEWRAVLGVLDRLSALGDDTVGLAEFRAALSLELDAPSGRNGRFGDGVFVGPVGSATGMVFERVYVVGMAEGTFPPQHGDDPLLPDRVRAADLRPRQQRRDEERRAFVHALHAGTECVLSAPRADQRSHQPRLPSRWFVEAATRLGGRGVTASRIVASSAEEPWLEVVPSVSAILLSRQRASAASLGEMRIGVLGACPDPARHPLVTGWPVLQRGLAAVSARATGGLTEWEGLVGRHESLAIDPGRALSPTSLQTWAQCPRRYLFERMLRVEPTVRPEEVLQLNPLDLGTLVHDALEEFFTEKAEAGELGGAWDDADRARLLEITDRRCQEVEAQGLTGKPVLWELQRNSLRSTLGRFLDRDAVYRAGEGLVPQFFEVGFGGAEDPLGPVTFVAGERTLRFRGRVDRIDATPDGSRVEVIDYKTGSSDRYHSLATDCVDGGRMLQLPVYALAARGQYPDAEVTASYWFVADAGSAHEHVPVALDDGTLARFTEVVGHIADGIEDGVFPANPGPETFDTWSNCRYCPYDRVCPAQRDQIWERVVLSDRASSYRALTPEPV